MYRASRSILIIVCLAALLSKLSSTEGQILDKILNTSNNRNSNDVEVISNDAKDLTGDPQQQAPVVSKVKDIFRDMMTVNVPVFYDMIRNGSSMGINVLSGLVKVERGEEAERSGLVGTGLRKPLSVRVFGVPVFERGTRVRPLDSDVSGGGATASAAGGKPTRPDEEELPL